ncbi:peptidylprolyl isomerase [Stratiformator vulcanicus]|uniref:Peptidyl-prolyl cis-trans isomerase n=1 Tax=Stratiformator vulcanicus TaxID=2527980 RepID=A0A517R355_9PLAN|nr:peptidylprolyl isomerase [Stratiformator vulcanicus]QDT38312.1 putative peptidyl-prolyl cis-trans isomerase [Stratiformator vulcanicus]
MADAKQAVQEAAKEIDFSSKSYQVHLETSEGPIRLEFFPDKAPKHCENFAALAKSNFYDDGEFHRVIEGFMIQGGCPEGSGMGGPGYQIDAEFNDVPHEEGTLSMARSQNPNSAGSQFFICLGRQDFLDGQYTAFGKTVDEESMQTVRSIGSTDTDGSDRPTSKKRIIKAELVEV